MVRELDFSTKIFTPHIGNPKNIYTHYNVKFTTCFRSECVISVRKTYRRLRLTDGTAVSFPMIQDIQNGGRQIEFRSMSVYIFFLYTSCTRRRKQMCRARNNVKPSITTEVPESIKRNSRDHLQWYSHRIKQRRLGGGTKINPSFMGLCGQSL